MLTDDQLRIIREHSKNEESFHYLVQLFLQIHDAPADSPEPITHWHTLSLELDAARSAAEHTNRAKTTFISNISHEIRTPLNSLLGITALLRDTNLTLEQREFADIIATAGASLRSLVDDILDLSQLEAGTFELEHTPFDPRASIEAAVDLVAAQAAEKQLDLSFFMSEAVPDRLVGDPTRLRQVVINLLSNAITFTEQGEVALLITSRPLPAATSALPDPHTKPAPADTMTPQRFELQIIVSDTGIGIAPEHTDNLSELFTHVDSTATHNYGGSGLGLVICKQIVDRMGGTISARSQPGEGSTFTLTLPLTGSTDETATYPRGAQPLLAAKRILIIVSTLSSGAMFSRLLNNWGAQTFITHSLETAANAVAQGQVFDALILDIHLVHTDNLALLQPIRHHADGEPLPLVLLASLGARKELEPWTERGVAAVLTRPVKPVQLYQTIGQLFKPDARYTVWRALLPQIDTNLAQHHPLRILIADDNPVNQRVLLLSLERLGYQADTAADGQAALERLHASHPQPYDVVMLDLQMPRLNGLALTRRIRAEWPSHEQPYIIGLSAHADRETRAQCLEIGMNDILHKAIHLEQLAALLHRCQPRHRPTTPHTLASTSQSKNRSDNMPAPDNPPATPEGQEPALPDLDDVLDREAMAQLCARLGERAPQKLPQLIGIFLEHATILTNRLREAIASSNTAEIRYVVHTLKSSSADMGATRLSQQCRTVEEIISGHVPPERLEYILEQATGVINELERVCLALQRCVIKPPE